MTYQFDTVQITKDALDVLKSVEWVHHNIDGGWELYVCPLCFGEQPKHGIDCKLERTMELLQDILNEN